MGDKHWYVCLDCEVCQSLEDYEGVEFLREHWGHNVIEVDYDDRHELKPIVLGAEK